MSVDDTADWLWASVEHKGFIITALSTAALIMRPRPASRLPARPRRVPLSAGEAQGGASVDRRDVGEIKIKGSHPGSTQPCDVAHRQLSTHPAGTNAWTFLIESINTTSHS